jgi:purine-binding chemotaxis protein CheW
MKDQKATSRQEQTIAIDWDDVHRRLATTQVALKRGLLPTPEEKKRILKERAKTLASEPRGEEETQESLEVVEFMLAYERYGIKTSCVREVYPLTEITSVPCTPPFVLGVINVRGQILSVVDLKKFFDLPEKGLTDLNKVIIIHIDKMEFGILADAVLGVRPIPLKEIQPSLPTLTDIRAQYLKGVTNERMAILDGEKILSDKNMVVCEGGEIK